MASSEIEWMRSMAANEKFHIFYNAPVVIIVSMLKSAMSPLVDCSAAIENMLLDAESMDIGSCWIGLAHFWFSKKEEVKLLELPEGYEPCYAVAFGYKDQRPSRALPRKANTVRYIEAGDKRY
ncbi:MAG: hypothetical protein Fur0012_14830 [Elusimicrobiota bacterium]